MKIGGLQKLTLIDYPGKPACTVFLAGCNLRCPWCHSPDLVAEQRVEKIKEIKREDFFNFLKKRREVLEGVVICGGEPTVNNKLPDFIRDISTLGYSVKLDTNGTNPEMLKKIIEEGLIDYVAMDVKAPLNRYEELFGFNIEADDLRRSISLIKSLKNYEFRTTLVPGIHNQETLVKIMKEVEGSKNFYLQNFRGKKTLSSNLEGGDGFSKKEMKEFKRIAKKYVKNCKIR